MEHHVSVDILRTDAGWQFVASHWSGKTAKKGKTHPRRSAAEAEMIDWLNSRNKILIDICDIDLRQA